MSSSKLLNIKNGAELSLFKTYPANMSITRWLSEMDGENIEEDLEIHSCYPKLDGPISCPSFKRVFKTSPCAIYFKR